MSKPLIVVNFKTYDSASAENADALAKAMEIVAGKDVEIIAVTSASSASNSLIT